MAKWCTSETGILRKKVVPENYEDLLVFGYACKLFRDDDKAKYIDQGKHLIPWMGDDTLRIDRYDCRGALQDLSSYESSREGYDAMRWLGLNESERKIEQLCDEERYHSLHSNQEEEEMYKEEELKRLQQKTNEFAYSYDVPQNPEISQNVDAPTCEEEDKEYVPKPELDVPADIAIPKTEKENTRIEKTALFVCKQGPQMEILIKTKQANNPQFSFLNQSDPLYKYYKHVLNALKAGTYKLESNIQEEEKKDAAEQDTNDEHYLHPSLLQTSVQPTPIPTIPTVTYKPTADCTYSQLVNRIQGSQVDSAGVGSVQNKNEADDNPQAQNQLSYEQQQQQYYQYYYAMQYYEYYKQLVQQFHSMGGTDGQTIPTIIQEQINAQAAACAQMAYTQYVQQNTTNPYSQLVSNLSQATKDGLYPTVQTNLTDTNPIGDIMKAPIIYGQSEPARPQVCSQNSNTNSPLRTPASQSEQSESHNSENKNPNRSLLCLAHYESGTDDEAEEETESKAAQNCDVGYKTPPDEMKLIIDKMASYVSKNGRDFESIVRSKGDPRFEFLNVDHEYHGYYKFKIKETEGGNVSVKEVQSGVQNGVESTQPEQVQKESQVQQQVKAKDKKIITPVSFSIKKPKEEIPKDIKSALPIEESDEEIPEDNPATTKETNTIKPLEIQHPIIHLPSTSTIATIIKQESPKEMESNTKELPPIVKEKKDTLEKKGENNVEVDDPILEMIDLTEDLEEKKDARRAENRIKDKLAAAAREKLASVSKDRALQIERKKKAAAFLKLKSAEGDRTKVSSRRSEKIEEDKVLVISDSDNRMDVEKEKNHRRSRSGTRESYSKRDESDSEEGEIKKHKKSKKKKSHHKRKRSDSRHRSRSHYKKAKKRRRRSESHHKTSSSDD